MISFVSKDMIIPPRIGTPPLRNTPSILTRLTPTGYNGSHRHTHCLDRVKDAEVSSQSCLGILA